jgi:NitT/TauT family transport system substrate-binding protein
MKGRVAAVVLALAVGSLVAGCGGQATAPGAPASRSGQGTGPSSAPPVARVPLHTAFTVTSAAMAPIFGAKDGGYFAAEGLDIPDLTLINGGAAFLASVQNQETPVAMSSAQFVMGANLEGGDYVLVGGFIDRILTDFWSVPSITSPEQLKGKTLGVLQYGSAGQISAEAALKHLGLAGQMNTVATGGTAQTVAAMLSGQVHATALAPPDSFKLRDAGMHHLLDVGSLNIKSQSTVVVTTRKFAGEHPDVVERYLRATLSGLHRMNVDREFALQAIGKYTKTEDRKVLEDTVAYYAPYWVTDGSISTEGIQANLDNLSQTVPAARSAKPEQFVDPSFLSRIKASGFFDQLK